MINLFVKVLAEHVARKTRKQEPETTPESEEVGKQQNKEFSGGGLELKEPR